MVPEVSPPVRPVAELRDAVFVKEVMPHSEATARGRDKTMAGRTPGPSALGAVGHEGPTQAETPPANPEPLSKGRYDRNAAHKVYMKEYMRKWRARQKS
jgi:hypothetical protein